MTPTVQTTTPPTFSKALLKAVSKDKTRGHLMGVAVYPDGWAYATDGHRLHGIKGEPLNPGVRTVVPIKADPDLVDFSYYPQVHNFIPAAAPERDLLVNRDALLKAVKAVEAHHKAGKQEQADLKKEADTLYKAKFPNKDVADKAKRRFDEIQERLAASRPYVSLSHMDGTLRVWAPGSTLAPVSTTPTFGGRNCTFTACTYAPGYLREALEVFPRGCAVTLRAPEDDRAPLMLSTDDAMALVMPVRL